MIDDTNTENDRTCSIVLGSFDGERRENKHRTFADGIKGGRRVNQCFNTLGDNCGGLLPPSR